MGAIDQLNVLTAKIRREINDTATVRKAISVDNAREFSTVKGAAAENVHKFSKVEITPRAHFSVPFPEIKSFEKLSGDTAAKLRGGLIDLDKVIVCTGFAEVGPFGSARTRWEMEARGEYSIEGLLELAFVMGLIKHHNGPLKSGAAYVGWVDAKSGEPIDDRDVRSKYEKVRWVYFLRALR
jgi:fatty acid synthase subunit alpha